MNKKRIIDVLPFVLIILIVIIGTSFTFLRNFHTDESWYFSQAWAIVNGEKLYTDFFAHHNPLVYYIYSLPQYFFGPSLLIGRFQSFIFLLISVLTLYSIATNLGNKWSGIIFLTLIITNIFFFDVLTTFTWRPLETIIISIILLAFIKCKNKIIRYSIVSFLLSLEVSLRFPIDFTSVLLIGYLIYLLIRYYNEKKIFFISTIISVITIGFLLGPFLVNDFDNYIFNTAYYNIMLGRYLSNEMNIFGEISINIYYLNENIRIFFQIIFFFCLIIIYRFYFIVINKNQLINKDNYFGEWWYFTIIYIIGDEALVFVSQNGWPITHVVHWFVGAMFVSIEIVRIINNLTNKESRHISIAIVLMVVTLYPLSQNIRDLQIRRKWFDSDMYQLINISKEIKSLTNKDDPIFTFNPALITLAERNVAFNNYEECVELVPSAYIDNDLIKNYSLTKINDIVEGLNNQSINSLLLEYPGRLDDNTGLGRILIPFRNQIRDAISENYYLIKSWEYGRGNFLLYFHNPIK